MLHARRLVRRFGGRLAVLLVAALALALPAQAIAAVDQTPPVVTAPTAIVTVWGTARDGAIPFTVDWSATDASGIAAHKLQMRVDGGAWSRVELGRQAGSKRTIRLAPRHDYQFRVRSTDRAGNTSSYSTGAAFRFRRLSELATGGSTTGSWTRRANDGFIGGHALVSGGVGAEYSFTFTGTQIAWIATVGPDQGPAHVFLDDTYKTVTNLNRRSTRYQRLAYRFAWPTSGEHVLRLESVTQGDPGDEDRVIDVDGLVVVEPVTSGG